VAGPVPAPLRAAVVRVACFVARIQCDLDAAEGLGLAGLAMARDLDDPAAVVHALIVLGFVAEDRGEIARSRGLWEEALALARPLDLPFWTSFAMQGAGWLALLDGDEAAAERLLDEALARARRDGPRVEALVLSDLAELALQRGEHARAAALWQDRLFLTGNEWQLRWSLEGLGAIAAACGEATRAARLLGAAEALRERLGTVLAPRLVGQYEATAQTVRAALGDATFTAAWDAGRAMTPTEARAEAARVAQGADPAATSAAAAVPQGELTPRERDVLRLLIQGKTDQQIADALFLSRRTVTIHASNLFAKLGVSNRVEATARAVREGLI
jgi:ATP/maltotriose-dependent transcriptional regulator MalT